jgi:outer membrane receptor protein involved in Fe transport
LPDTGQGSLKSNLLGANASYRLNSWWTHNLVIGWNDNSFGKESFVRASPYIRRDSKIKGPSLRYYNTVSFGGKSDIKATLLTGAEYSNTLATGITVSRTATAYRFQYETSDIQKNTGVFAQLNPSYKNKIFLTLAGRYEFNKNFGSYFNPRIGLTTNFLVGNLTVKPRVAWGRGIISLPPSLKEEELNPQQQAGWDYGLEGYLANDRLRFEVSRYDNILKDALYTSVQTSPTGALITNTNAGKN